MKRVQLLEIRVGGPANPLEILRAICAAFKLHHLTQGGPPRLVMADEQFMRLAIDKAREGIAGGGSPFGACIVREGAIVACVHNVVWQTMDVTAHAEVHALREACRVLGTIDLSDCVIYSTCEPCPMCFTAIHWARIPCIVFGVSIADAAEVGFNELPISNETLRALAGSGVEIVSGCLREENRALMLEWASRPGRRAY